MRIAQFLLAALLLLVARPLAAQLRVTELGPGTAVRVSPRNAATGPGWIEGRVLFADTDSLVIRRRGRREPATFRRAEIGVLEVAILRPRVSHAVRYAAVAGLLAGGSGAAFGALGYDEDDPGGLLNLSRRENAAFNALLFGVPAALLGGAVGTLTREERWTPIPLPAAPAVSVRRDGSVGIALSLTL